uniref:Uncharacterized protein n=1 Tax=Rhizophora mucronata TaxID=61149 RepID=A0A2P2QFP4_RHIMU
MHVLVIFSELPFSQSTQNNHICTIFYTSRPHCCQSH